MKRVINRQLSIDTDEVEMHAMRAGGPGGQNVNKVATAIHLRFDIAASSLPAEVKQRLLGFRDRRVNSAGVVVIKAQRFRDQDRNREDALDRLADLLRAAWARPKPRQPTRPTQAARRRRLEAKARRGRVKALRGRPGQED